MLRTYINFLRIENFANGYSASNVQKHCRRKYPYCSEEKEKESGEYLESLSS